MAKALLELALEASGCTKCALAETRTKVVFGAGKTSAEVMFIGEAPGFNEDQEGEPFVGAAGHLLDRLLGEIGLSRDQVYIANVLKCRPPNNRDPRDEEIEACKGYLLEQINLVSPRVIVTLGNFSTKLLLRTDQGISKLRGHVVDWWQGIQLIPTYHPAAALRGGDKIEDAMQADFVLIRSIIDRPLTGS